MADAAVEFLLDNLRDLLAYHIDLIANTQSQIEDLEKDLQVFRAFLKDSVKERRKVQVFQMLARNIRDVVYDVEDIIDTFVTQATEIRSKNIIQRAYKSPISLHSIGKKVAAIRKKVEQGRIDYGLLSLVDEDKYEKPEVRLARQKDVVGFKDVTAELIDRLTTKTKYLDIISLIGMFGLGKTTLAWKIFNDEKIVFEFPIRIWLPISQQFANRDIFLAILQKYTTLTKELRRKDDQELSKMVADYLESGKYLIVMDDVWSTSDWDRLSAAMPVNNTKGKVLITSREKDVGGYVNLLREPISLRFFTPEESWELLRLKALGQLNYPSDLENAGKLIARDCKGLPLAIVVIGGILAKKSATRRAWEKVSTRVSTHLNEDQEGLMNKFISLSYDKLPYHLRACFLYLGIFPEDYEIPASKLIRMWIGEGFVQQKKDFSLEETAENYLEDLINRNLVMIEKIKPDGQVKTCRIHDFLRDFCRAEAGNEMENFLQVIRSNGEVFEPPLSDIHKYRRISIHSNCLTFLSSKPLGPRVRSFVCIPKHKSTLPKKDSPAIPAAFNLLRVLDVKPIIFSTIHKDMYQLVHLRFIALSFDSQTLPAKFSKLWNIQTLIVDTTSHKLEVKADLLEMKQLRHFKTNVPATLSLNPGKGRKHGAELQTLGTISAESCTPELLDWASNVKKLGIRGRLASLLGGKIGSFSSLVKLRNLEKLQLINDVYPEPASEGKLLVLPEPNQFPSTIRSLTLCATLLSWSYMSTLARLDKLEVLKLKDKAFEGPTWEVNERFARLEFLHIEDTNLGIWEASSHDFPSLKGLVLRSCEELIGIPVALAEIPSLHVLDLYMCRSAAASARIIQVEKQNNPVEGGIAFNLSIFPPSN